jgi:pilus assembly protein CpaB
VRPGSGQASDQLVATLRVTVRQAVYLTAAQNFAQEVRLLPRPSGDSGDARRLSVGGPQL